MDIITCLIYSFPQDTGWGDQANFIISSSQKGKASSGASSKLVYPQWSHQLWSLSPWALGAADRGERQKLGVREWVSGPLLHLRPEAQVATGLGASLTSVLPWWRTAGEDQQRCSCLENPRDGEPGGLQSMGSHRVGHDWCDSAAAAAVHTGKRCQRLGRQLCKAKVTTSSQRKHRHPDVRVAAFKVVAQVNRRCSVNLSRSSPRQTCAHVLTHTRAGTSENTIATSRGPLNTIWEILVYFQKSR